MNRFSKFCFVTATAFAFVSSTISFARADVVISTIDFNGGTPSGLQRYDETTGTALTVGDTPPFAVTGIGPFGPTDVAVGPHGNLFAVDGFTGQILFFDGATGIPLPSPIPMAPDGLFTGLANPPTTSLSFTSLTFGSDNNLYAVDAYDVGGDPDNLKPGIRIYNGTTGAPVDTLLESTTTFFVSLAGLTFDNNGDLLVSDRDAGAIYKVDVATDTETLFISSGVGGNPIFPAGMAVSSTGEIYVADLLGNAIVKYDAAGANPTLLAQIPPLPAPGPLFSNFPSDIIFDRDGNLLVAVLGAENPGIDGTAAGQILRYSTSGALLQTVAADLRPTSSLILTDDLLPADFDGNGDVDQGDYGQWVRSFGDPVTPTNGSDANGDGMVDAADYAIWRDTLGVSGIRAGNGTAATVPEPTSVLMIGLAAAFLLNRRFVRH